MKYNEKEKQSSLIIQKPSQLQNNGERLIYTFENKCKEDESLSLGDEAYKVIVNANGNREGLSDEMSDFLDFLQGKENDGILSEQLDKAVKNAIRDGTWKEEYDMTWTMKIDEEREDAAIIERIEAARDYGVSDEKLIEKLMSKFGLTKEEAEEEIRKYDNSLQIA